MEAGEGLTCSKTAKIDDLYRIGYRIKIHNCIRDYYYQERENATCGDSDDVPYPVVRMALPASTLNSLEFAAVVTVQTSL
jgi:hypothetical protein